jgi:hypothetical protein
MIKMVIGIFLSIGFASTVYSEAYYCSENINSLLCDSLNGSQLDKYKVILDKKEIDSLNLTEIAAYNNLGIENLDIFPDDKIILSKRYTHIWAKTSLKKGNSPVYDPIFNAIMQGVGVVSVLWISELAFYPYTKKYDVEKVAIVSAIAGGIIIPLGAIASIKYYKPEIEIKFNYK